MVPQLRRENSLLLWNVFDLNTPVHTFVGHDDVVLEFQWRKQKEGEWEPDFLLSLFTAAPVGLAVWSSAEDADPSALGLRNGRVRETATIHCRWVKGCGAMPSLPSSRLFS